MTRTQQLEQLRRKVKRWQVGTMGEAYQDLAWAIGEIDHARATLSRLAAACPPSLEERREAMRVLE